MIVCVNKEEDGRKKIVSPQDGARGERIREVRLSLGMTQLEFAMFLGRTPTTVARWERGSTTPNAQDLWAIEKKTGVTSSSILDGTEGGNVPAPEILTDFFKSPAGERLTGEQRRGLVMLLRDQSDVDVYRIRAALDLLLPPKAGSR